MSVVIPDAIEPVVGWKAWDTSEDYLFSPRFPQIWRPGEQVEAICVQRSMMIRPERIASHLSPVNGCQCGIYIAERFGIAYPYVDARGVIGHVYGWGKVIEHKLGWRVQYAYPKEFYVGDYMPPEILRMLERYEVPLRRMSRVFPQFRREEQSS